MKVVSFVFALLLSAQAFAQSSPCDYYAQKANMLGCGGDNYLLKFGYRYCKIFEAREPTFSAAAKPILDNIRACLIFAMDEHHPTCDTASSIGYGSHTQCYLDSGFCDMPEIDKLHIFWIVRAEVANPTFRAIATDIQRKCVERTAR